MERRKVYHNQDGYRRTLITDDADPYTVHSHTALNLDPIIAQVEHAKDYSRALKHNRLLAKVPMTVYEQSVHEGWGDDDWKRWLNDPQNKPFRVWEGSV
jgi:hypothetical protein